MESKVINFRDMGRQVSDGIVITEEEEETSKLEYPITHEDGRLYCQVCGKLFKTITASHLKKFHGMNPVEYKEKYGTPIVSEATKALRKYTNSQVFSTPKEEVKVIPPVADFDDVITDEEDIQDVIEELVDDTILDEEITDDIDESEFQFEEIPVPSKDPAMMKTEIAYHLENVFEGHSAKENYIIEEFEIGSFVDTTKLKYSYATDVAIPSKRIALFFPNTFWHNHDLNADPNRDYNLREDGWNVIEIKGNNPSFDQILSALKNADLL